MYLAFLRRDRGLSRRLTPIDLAGERKVSGTSRDPRLRADLKHRIEEVDPVGRPGEIDLRRDDAKDLVLRELLHVPIGERRFETAPKARCTAGFSATSSAPPPNSTEAGPIWAR